MANYIDRQEALSFPFANGQYDHEHADKHFINGCETYKEYLEQLPFAGVAEVRHGRWVYKPDMYDDSTWECSECGEPYTLIDGTPLDNLYFYCPNCGARMDGEQG